MSKLACWEYIKAGCNKSQVDSLAAFNAQQDALWYEGRIKTELPQADQEEIERLAAEVAAASQVMRRQAERLKEFVKGKAEAAQG